ncbi:MAG: hypothetical protein QOE89_764 [Pseudonocardiales bacterium]|nr:hypothetical protein [Pseudonocardiales bacterium]
MFQNVESIRRPGHREQPPHRCGQLRQPERATGGGGIAVQLVKRHQSCGAEEIDAGKVDDQVPPGRCDGSQSIDKAMHCIHVHFTVQIGDSVLLIDVQRAREYVHRSAPFAGSIHAVGTLCQPELDRCTDPVERKKGDQTDLWGRAFARREWRAISSRHAADGIAVARRDHRLPAGCAV